MKTKNTKSNLSFHLLILIFVLLAAGILAAGHFFFNDYANSYRAKVESELSAVADLKAAGLVQWRKERLGDANLFYKNAAFSGLVQRCFEHPDDVDTQEQLRSWLACFEAYDQYARIFLLDTRGVARTGVPDTAEPVPRHIAQDTYQALKSGKVMMLDLHRDEDTPQIHMEILTPVFSQKDGNLPLGAVVMRIDPYHYLYPMIQKWPAPSATTETLLIRREGNDALFLNELRFQKDTALKLRSSLENIKMPAVQAALGHEGNMEGIDYRGTAVIAAVLRVPDSPWSIVASMESADAYTHLTQMRWLIIATIGALLIGAGAGVVSVWRQQNMRVKKEQVQAADELQNIELRYRDVVNNSKNAVAVYAAAADGQDFIIRDFNQAAQSIENVKKEDIIGKSLLQAYPGIKESGLFEVLQRVWRTGASERHIITQDHDGRTSVWHDNYVYRLASGEIVAIYEDITQRKHAEEMLRHEQIMLARTESIAHIGSWEWDIATDTVTWSDELFRIFQRDPKEGAPSFAGHPAFYHPDDMARLRQAVEDCVADGTPYQLELRALRKDGISRVCVARGAAEMGPGGRPIRLFGSLQDITERKQAEEELEKSHRELRSLSAHLISLREEERMMLARDMHDELGQALTALKMDLSWLSKKLPEGQESLAKKTKSMFKLVNNTVKAVKRISTGLRPGLLDDLGLMAALEWQAGEFQARTGIKTGLSFKPDDIIVDNERATALFRIFQEVLTNISRHAAATRVDAYLYEKNGSLELSVSDNGRGIGQKMINSSKSLGLIGMRERCHHLGGAIDIMGKPGKGTIVTVSLPAGEARSDKNTGG